jgi:hypothetical protein
MKMDKYKLYAIGFGGNSEQALLWINTVLKNYLKKHREDQSEIEHIIDYLVSDKAPKRLGRMSYKEAKVNAKKWTDASQKKGRGLKDSSEDIEVVHDFFDGYKIVKLLTKKAFQREGSAMSHCLAGYGVGDGVEIYSYRDAKNMPHATFEVRKEGGEILQIKGKGNGSIHPKYITPILSFLDLVGQTVRPSEMKNLGYHHVPKDMVPMFNLIKGASEKMKTIKNEHYFFESD